MTIGLQTNSVRMALSTNGGPKNATSTQAPWMIDAVTSAPVTITVTRPKESVTTERTIAAVRSFASRSLRLISTIQG